MNLEFLVERLAQMLLVFVLLDEGAPLIDALEVLNNANLASIVHFFVVLKQLVDYLFVHGLS